MIFPTGAIPRDPPDWPRNLPAQKGQGIDGTGVLRDRVYCAITYKNSVETILFAQGLLSLGLLSLRGRGRGRGRGSEYWKWIVLEVCVDFFQRRLQSVSHATLALFSCDAHLLTGF